MTCSERFNIFSVGSLSQLWNCRKIIFGLHCIHKLRTMLFFYDFVAARKRFYNLSRRLFISASKHCRKMNCRKIWNTHSSNTSKQNLLILLCLSDFMTCRKHFNVQSEGVDISALEHCRNMKFRTCLHLTLI